MGKGSETRERILEHAVKLASRDGLAGLSIGGLAEDLGLSKSGLFAHFGSKEELQKQAIDAANARFLEVVMKPALAYPRGEARVRALFDRWLAWDSDPSMPGGCVFIAASIELDDQPGPVRDHLLVTQRQWLESLAKSAKIAIDTGEFRPDLDAHQFAFEMSALVFGHHHHKRLVRDPRAEYRARTAFERLLRDARRR